MLIWYVFGKFRPFLGTKSVIAQKAVGDSQSSFRKSILTASNVHCVTRHVRLKTLFPLKSRFSALTSYSNAV